MLNPFKSIFESYKIVQGGGNSLVEAMRNNHSDFIVEYDQSTVIAESNAEVIAETTEDDDNYERHLKDNDKYREFKADQRSEGHGGVIVFSTDVNSKQLSANAVVNWAKQKLATIGNRLSAFKKLDKIRRKFKVYAWTIGRFFKGVYTGRNGVTFDENSLSIEVILIDRDKLFDIAKEIKSDFDQESVLVKDYSNGQVYFV